MTSYAESVRQKLMTGWKTTLRGEKIWGLISIHLDTTHQLKTHIHNHLSLSYPNTLVKVPHCGVNTHRAGSTCHCCKKKMTIAFNIIPNCGAASCLAADTGLKVSWMQTVFVPPVISTLVIMGRGQFVAGTAHPRSHECTATAAQMGSGFSRRPDNVVMGK